MLFFCANINLCLMYDLAFCHFCFSVEFCRYCHVRKLLSFWLSSHVLHMLISRLIHITMKTHVLHILLCDNVSLPKSYSSAKCQVLHEDDLFMIPGVELLHRRCVSNVQN